MRIESIAEALQSLADPIRLRVLHLLFSAQGRPWSVGAIVESLALPQPTVSRHLATLRESGFVDVERRGRERLYRLSDAQHPLHSALLAALEAFVVPSPAAREDVARAPTPREGLREPPINAMNEFHDAGSEEGEEAMDAILGALSHATRRRILDRVGRRPGLTLGALAEGFPVSRAAIAQHLAVLERAGLVHSARRGRERRLYADAVPIQLVYDRFTTRFTAPLASHVAAIKYAAEGP